MHRLAIRVKVWQVLVGLLVLGAGGFAFTHVSDRILYEIGMEARRIGDHARASALFDRFARRCPSCQQAPEALYYTAGHFRVDQQDYTYVFAGGGYSWSQRTVLPEMAFDAEARYRRLIDKYSDTTWAWRAREDLTRLLIDQGRYEEALQGIDRFLAEELPDYVVGPRVKRRLEHLRIVAEYKSENYERVVELAQVFQLQSGPVFDTSSNRDTSSGGVTRSFMHYDHYRAGDSSNEPATDTLQRQVAVAESYLKLGQVDEALRWFEGVNWVFQRARLTNSPDLLRLEQVRAMEDGAVGVISGTVSGGPTGASGVEVFIANAEVPQYLVHRDELLVLTTPINEDGTFHFDAVPPGRYHIGLRAPGKQDWLREFAYVGPEELVVESGSEVSVGFRLMQSILPSEAGRFVQATKDAVTVAWEPVEGASYYELRWGIIYRSEWGQSAMSVVIVPSTTYTRHTFDPFELRWTAFFRNSSSSGPNSEMAPFSHLGALYPGGEYYVDIIAYDELGTVAVSSSKNVSIDTPQYPGYFTYLDPSQLSAEERLLLERKYDQALEGLERRWAEEPADVNAGLILLQVYKKGTNLHRERVDLDRAAELARELLQHDLPEAVRDEVAGALSYAERNR